MDTVTWAGLHKLIRLALMGIGAAVAAVFVSVLLGFGASSAHAADDEERGLLGAVTGLVGDTTSIVGSTVTGVTSTATDLVTSVVEVVPAPVQQPVSTVVETVGSTVETVVAPVQEVVSNDVVGSVVQPVVDHVVQPVVSVVAEVPVVGGVVPGLGLDTALVDIAANVDDTLATVVGAVSDTGTALVPPPAPLVPDVDGALPVPAPATASPDAAAATHVLALAETAPTGILFSSSSNTPATSGAVAVSDALAAVKIVAAAGLATMSGTSELLHSMGALCLSVISTGPGGAGLGVWALAALLPFVAHRAWVRRAGPEDEQVPAAPAGSTDVSPD